MARGNPRYFDADELRGAVSDDFHRDLGLTNDIDRHTAQLLTIFYALYGLGPDRIPFTNNGTFVQASLLEDVRR